jgi:hypothetical protein
LNGRRHAGETLAELLWKRDEGSGRPIQMSDAPAANTSVEKNMIRAYCLAYDMAGGRCGAAVVTKMRWLIDKYSQD